MDLPIKDEIKCWLEDGNNSTNSHLIVVCDTFDYEYYPVYVKNDEDVKEKMGKYNSNNMQKIMEVYDYSLDLNMQLNEGRTYHTNTKVKSSVERPPANNNLSITPLPIVAKKGQRVLLKVFIKGVKI